MKKYKVGDKVRIKDSYWFEEFCGKVRSNIDESTLEKFYYGGQTNSRINENILFSYPPVNFIYLEEIYKYSGKLATIKSITSTQFRDTNLMFYRLDIDNGSNIWGDFAFDDIDKKLVDHRRIINEFCQSCILCCDEVNCPLKIVNINTDYTKRESIIKVYDRVKLKSLSWFLTYFIEEEFSTKEYKLCNIHGVFINKSSHYSKGAIKSNLIGDILRVIKISHLDNEEKLFTVENISLPLPLTAFDTDIYPDYIYRANLFCSNFCILRNNCMKSECILFRYRSLFPLSVD